MAAESGIEDKLGWESRVRPRAGVIAATVRSTASLIALSAHASDCALCICSAMSPSRF